MGRILADRFRTSIFALIAVAALAAAGHGTWCRRAMSADNAGSAQQRDLTPRELNVWGRFSVGTWKQVRITTETLNERGEVADTTTTDTKSTLVRADSRHLALRIEASVQVAGKRFQSPPQLVECGYFDEGPNQSAESKAVGTSQLLIDGQYCPCEIRQIDAIGAKEIPTSRTRLYLSDDVEPFVLLRETTLLKDGKTPIDQTQKTTSEVIALDRPYCVLNDLKSVAYERTTQKMPRGTNVALDVVCVDVPGGTVARTVKEFDNLNHLVRQSSLELINYHVVADDDDSSQILTRRQARRARRH